MQRINMDVDKALWKQTGIRAAEEGITKKALVEKALREYLRKEKTMEPNLTHRDLYFAHAATNGRTDHSDLEFEVSGVKYLIRNVPAPEGWDGESDWTDDDEYIDRVVKERVASKEYEVSVDGEWQSAE